MIVIMERGGEDPIMTSDDKGMGVCTLDDVIKKNNLSPYFKVLCFVKLTCNLNNLMVRFTFLKLSLILGLQIKFRR